MGIRGVLVRLIIKEDKVMQYDYIAMLYGTKYVTI
jgi:hypothetical protein